MPDSNQDNARVFGDLPVEPAICLAPDDTDIRMVLRAELPRCPLCDGTPTTFTRYFEHSGIYQSYVSCSQCMAQVFVNSRDREDARNQAVAAWKRRPARQTATSEVAGWREALTKCRDQFGFYVQSHLAKHPPDVDKAVTNQQFVDLCDAILTPPAPASEVGR